MEEYVLETSQTRIQRILNAHRFLMTAYEMILRSTESQNMHHSYEFEVTNLGRYLHDKKLGYYERFQILGILLSYYSIKITGEEFYLFLRKKIGKKDIGSGKAIMRRKALRPLLVYFLQTHMRKKLDMLLRLYRREIVSQYSGEVNWTELEQLRNITTDMQNYLDLLPNTKKVIWTIIIAISTIIAIIDFVGLKPMIFDALKTVTIDWVFIILIVGYFISFFLATPLIQTFGIKRTLLLKTNSWHHYLDIYLDKGNKLYHESIYKLEDDLFDVLGAKNQKPKELPVDLATLITFRGSLIGIIAGGILIRITEHLLGIVPINSSDWSNILNMSIIVIVFGVFYFIGPYLEYKRRISNKLV